MENTKEDIDITKTKEKDTIAIDVGGVLIEKKSKYGADTNFDINDIKWMPGALDAVKFLSKHYNVYILSFCGKRTEMETRLALRKEIVNHIPENKWIFTRERKYKVDRMKEYAISALIDDTSEIIKWVEDAGLIGIHYGSESFPDWKSITDHLGQKVVTQTNANRT